jgi:ATP-binding cassette subfamily B protein
MEGKTAIIVAHRLSTIKNVDEIYVMDSGSIVDRGKHEELIKVDNIYSKLYSKQFNIYDSQETAIGEV